MRMMRLIGLAGLLGVGCAAPPPSTERQSPIIGGALDHADPSVVSLVMADGSPDCTASVIAPNILLTAAHCVDVGSQYKAVFGLNETAGDHTIMVTETHADPMYNDNDIAAGHDFAIAILASASPSPAIAINRAPLEATMVGHSARLVGFGVTATDQSGGGEKREITVPITEVQALHIKLGSPGHAACHGDSGGPAFANMGSSEILVGVTSYGDDDNCASGVAYYSRVDANLPFIDSYLNGTATIGAGSTGPSTPATAGGKPTDPNAPSTPTDPNGKPASGGTDPGGKPTDGTDPGGKPTGGTNPGTGCDPKDPGCK